MVFKHATLNHYATGEMLRKRLVMQEEVDKKTSAYIRGYYHKKKKSQVIFEDSDWFTHSLSDHNMVYLLHVYENEPIPYVHHKRGGGTELRNKLDYRGRIECDCKSFIYNDDTPRHCKHTLELSKRIYGEKSPQHQRLLLGAELDEPDVWCSHLAEMDTKIYNEEKAKRIEGKLRLRKDSMYARIPIEEQKLAREHYAQMMGRNK
jgi:hypothetical protein